MDTTDLARQIMKQMHAPEETDEEAYVKNLALLVSW